MRKVRNSRLRRRRKNSVGEGEMGEMGDSYRGP